MSKVALRNLNQVNHTSNPLRSSTNSSWVTHRGSRYRIVACQAVADLACLAKGPGGNMQIAALTPVRSKASNRSIYCLQYLPPQMRLTPTVIQSVGLWGGTAALGAIWLVQVNLPYAQGHAKTTLQPRGHRPMLSWHQHPICSSDLVQTTVLLHLTAGLP